MTKAGILEIFRQHELILELTKRQLTLSHKGSVLGVVWILLSPLTTLAIYLLVFGFIFGGKFMPDESKFDYGLGIFLGLAIVHFLSEIFGTAPQVMFAHSNYLKRSTIPIQIIPVVTLLCAIFHLLVSTIFVILGHIISKGSLSPNTLWIFPLGMCLFSIGLGLSWLLASLGTLFRDISQFAGPLSLGTLFCSAVFYPIDQIPESIWNILKFNPILHVVNELRSTVLWNEPIDLGALQYLIAVSGTTLILGWFVFSFTKSKLIEIV